MIRFDIKRIEGDPTTANIVYFPEDEQPILMGTMKVELPTVAKDDNQMLLGALIKWLSDLSTGKIEVTM